MTQYSVDDLKRIARVLQASIRISGTIVLIDLTIGPTEYKLKWTAPFNAMTARQLTRGRCFWRRKVGDTKYSVWYLLDDRLFAYEVQPVFDLALLSS